MSYMNITIVGNVGRDAEIRYTPQGVAVADFSVAVNKVTGRGDSRKEKTLWFKVSIWRERAETLSQYIKKGTRVLVSGDLDYSTYVDKAGQTQVSLEITMREIELLTSREEAQRMGESGGSDEAMYEPVNERPQKPQRGANSGGRGRQPETEDDIPF
jgi:single-strand DNA-binding protein